MQEKIEQLKQEYETLKKLILKIHSVNPQHNILILARKN